MAYEKEIGIVGDKVRKDGAIDAKDPYLQILEHARRNMSGVDDFLKRNVDGKTF